MPYLTFGEQVKIVLSRRGMTIKELAEIIEERTGKKMSRQNLTQRLGRDNFQEQDMRMIASILQCPFQLSILGEATESVEEFGKYAEETVKDHEKYAKESVEEFAQDSIEEIGKIKEIEKTEVPETSERGMTVGEFLDKQEEMDETSSDILLKEVLAEMDAIERENREKKRERDQLRESEKEKEKKSGWMSHLRFRRKEEKLEETDSYFDEDDEITEIEDEGIIDRDETEEDDESEEKADKFDVSELSKERLKSDREASERSTSEEEAREKLKAMSEADEEDAENLEIGDVNPYTGREYETNSVRMHPRRIGYVQVYDRKEHKWTDMTEWAFLGYQERKKVLLGKDYEPPIYLD